MSGDGIGLKYAVEQLGSAVRVSYRVTNGSERSIFLTTPLVEIDNEGITPDAERVYAYLDPDGVLHLTKRVWPVPDDVDVYLPEVPRLTEVRAGGTFEERFTCALPVEVRYPYRFAGEEEPEGAPERVSGEVEALAFSIGYLVEGDGEAGGIARRMMEEVEGAGGQGGFVVGYARATAYQQLLQGAAVAVRVGVVDVNR